MSERRRRRSREFRFATRYYLQSVAQQHRVSVLALIDQEGEFVAGSEGLTFGADFLAMGMAEPMGRNVAALAVAVGAEGGSSDWVVCNEPVTVSSIAVQGRLFRLVSTGSQAPEVVESVCKRLPQIVADC